MVLTIHRGTRQIGGNCVELICDGHRLLLDAGSPLDGPDSPSAATPIPPTLDLSRPIDGLVISHPHMDHYGLLDSLPADWPVWSGEPTEELMRLTAVVGGRRTRQTFRHYRSGEPFFVGPFAITPYLTDHSAFDAHMLLVEVSGKRLLYSGDFRRTGRKAILVQRMLEHPPSGVDVLLLEGTTLGRPGGYPTESDLEVQFIELFRRTRGRVFVTWSAQNIDRTVAIYRACLRAGRTLILDVYSADVLERMARFADRLPHLGCDNLKVVVTGKIARMYDNPARLDNEAFVEKCASSGNAFSAAKLAGGNQDVIMLRPSLWTDFERKGVTLNPDDAWVFSMWAGYLQENDYPDLRRRFEEAGATIQQIHTSGHAAPDDLVRFAQAVAPKCLVPIHGEAWDRCLHRFDNVRRLNDGEQFEVV